jgi:hypothetical protein
MNDDTRPTMDNGDYYRTAANTWPCFVLTSTDVCLIDDDSAVVLKSAGGSAAILSATCVTTPIHIINTIIFAF